LLAVLALAAAGLGAALRMPRQVSGETRSGWINIVWQTQGAQNHLAEMQVYLVDAQGSAVRLQASDAQLAPYGGALRLNGQRVTVSGDLLPALRAGGMPALRLRSLARSSGGPRLATYSSETGPRPYVLLLCNFADQTNAETQPRATYERWLGSAYPGIGHFWGENSENRIALTGVVVGPFTLPLASSAYMTGSQANVALLAQDCTHAADATVNFTQYAGIHMQFNSGLGGYSWGGSWTTTLDGSSRRWPMTWFANWASQSTYAHETGHSLGLPHSSGPYGNIYDSRWDVMSGGASFDTAEQTYVAAHTIAFHKDLLGWIPGARKLRMEPGSSATVDLVRNAIPGSQGYQMVQVPLGSEGTRFYTVEARRYAGYDASARLPGEGVVLHRVNLDDHIPATVVDADGNGNPNDAGAMWTPGETFTDLQGGVQLRVLAATADGYRVEVNTAGSLPLQLDSLASSALMGADYSQALGGGMLPGATWSLVAGLLPKGLTLTPDGVLQGVPAESGTFRFSVNVVQGGGFAVRGVRLQVTKPTLAAEAVLDQVLGTGTLSPDQVRFLDLLGNGNGRLDVGDLRAWLADQGTTGL
jgi:M6 family metalloprotease-like protein